MVRENEVTSGKKIEHMYQYQVGGKIQGDVIKKIYFYDDEQKYIIIENGVGEIRHYGGQQISKGSPLLAQCNSLAELIRGEKMKERVNYEKALAINEILSGNIEESEKILTNTIERIKEGEVIRKKLFYIGVYLVITALMVLVTLLLPYVKPEINEVYLHFVKIAMFGALGGFVSLNIRLKKIEFEISETTWSYIFVSVYKLAFAMVSSLISYFLIESGLIFAVFKEGSENYIYLEYVVAALAGFSESLLPNIFSSFEKEASIQQRE